MNIRAISINVESIDFSTIHRILSYIELHSLYISERRLLAKEFQREGINGFFSLAWAAKGNVNIALILKFYTLGGGRVIGVVTNSDVQKRRETSLALS